MNKTQLKKNLGLKGKLKAGDMLSRVNAIKNAQTAKQNLKEVVGVGKSKLTKKQVAIRGLI